MARLATAGEVKFQHRSGIHHGFDVSMIAKIEVGAADREPDIGDDLVGLGNMQRMNRTSGFEEIRPGDIDLRILEILPRALDRESKDLTRVSVALDGHIRFGTQADDPEA